MIFLLNRKVADRPRDPAKWDEIADVVAAVSIPVIANGDVFEYNDIERIKVATGSLSDVFKYSFDFHGLIVLTLFICSALKTCNL